MAVYPFVFIIIMFFHLGRETGPGAGQGGSVETGGGHTRSSGSGTQPTDAGRLSTFISL